MFKYEIIIYWSKEDESFIAEVPELSGCIADGKTYNEALENIQITMSEWVNIAQSLGRTLPELKGKLMYA